MTGIPSKDGVTISDAPDAAIAATARCGAIINTSLDVFTKLICTLPENHAGDHYDDIFSRGWMNA